MTSTCSFVVECHTLNELLLDEHGGYLQLFADPECQPPVFCRGGRRRCNFLWCPGEFFKNKRTKLDEFFLLEKRNIEVSEIY